jgi:hypothetical protein
VCSSDLTAGTWYQHICVSPAGDVAYCISGGQSVDKLDRGTGKFSTIFQAGAGQSFVDIAIDNNNILYVLGNNPVSVIKMDTSGNVQANITNGYLTIVTSIAVSDSALFCACSNYRGVFLLDKTSGAFQSEIYHSAGSWQVSTTTPNPGDNATGNIASSQGSLYAAFFDGVNPAAVFNASGAYQGSHGVAADYSDPWSTRITADDSGKIYVSDQFNGFIKEVISGTTLYTEPLRNSGEFANISDMCAASDNTLYIVDNALWKITSLTSDGQFHSIDTPGSGAGQILFPQSIAATASDIFVGCPGASNKIMHYRASGAFVGSQNIAEGPPNRMIPLSGGRLLVWTGAASLHTYSTASLAWLADVPISHPNAALAQGVYFCVATEKIYCAFYGSSFASVGILSSDLATYTEIWTSANDPVFSQSGLPGEPFQIAGIAPAPAGDVWVTFSSPGAVVRITQGGGVFASFAVRGDYQGGQSWNAGKIVAYALGTNGNGPHANVMTADPLQNVYVSYDGPNIAKYSPEVALQ